MMTCKELRQIADDVKAQKAKEAEQEALEWLEQTCYPYMLAAAQEGRESIVITIPAAYVGHVRFALGELGYGSDPAQRGSSTYHIYWSK